MYTIKAERAGRIVRAELSGFFSPAEVAAFARDEQAAAAALGCGTGRFGLLIVTLGGTAQAQDVIGAFQGLMQDLPLKSARIALVCESALLKMQLRRIIPADRASVFDTEAQARGWLEVELDAVAAQAAHAGALPA